MKIEHKLKPLRTSGFTLVEIMVVVAIIGLLMSVATVGINHAVKTAQKNTCWMNSAAIDGAKQLWQLENKKGDNDVATEEDLKPWLKNNAFPSCPSGGTYTINPDNTPATCSTHGNSTTPTTSTASP